LLSPPSQSGFDAQKQTVTPAATAINPTKSIFFMTFSPLKQIKHQKSNIKNITGKFLNIFIPNF
jgi:hypothetical protein